MRAAEPSEESETDVTAGARAQNREQRRGALVEAAYALFAERGYAATTMDGIAARAGLSRRTAFRYFQSKEQLVFPERDERLALLRAQLEPRDGERVFETVRRACLALGRHYQADRARMLAQWAVVHAEPALLGREMQLDGEFERVIEDAFLRDERDGARGRRRAAVRASIVVGAVRATLREWAESGGTADLVKLGRETWDELERGLGTSGAGTRRGV